MKRITKTNEDSALLKALIEKGIPKPPPQPASYEGFVVIKPWGYELQVFDNKLCCTWLACLKPGEAVSMHCHERKKAAFVPLSPDIVLRTLSGEGPLTECMAVDEGVFHSQENVGTSDAFFLEYEWPSEKSDLVRYKDRYGRESQGYEGRNRMIPLDQFRYSVCVPDAIKFLIGEAA